MRGLLGLVVAGILAGILVAFLGVRFDHSTTHPATTYVVIVCNEKICYTASTTTGGQDG